MKKLITATPSSIEIETDRMTIVVIDMQNACIAKGGMFDLGGADVSLAQRVIDPINNIAKASRAIHRPMIFIQHQYSEDFRELGDKDSVLWQKSRSYIVYHEHPEWRDKLLMRDTWGAEIYPALERDETDIVVEKARYTAFWGTSLDTVLRNLNTRYLAITGIWASMCVEATLRDASNYGYFPIFVNDAVGSGDEESLARTEQIAQYYGWVTSSEELCAALSTV